MPVYISDLSCWNCLKLPLCVSLPQHCTFLISAKSDMMMLDIMMKNIVITIIRGDKASHG